TCWRAPLPMRAAPRNGGLRQTAETVLSARGWPPGSMAAQSARRANRRQQWPTQGGKKCARTGTYPAGAIHMASPFGRAPECLDLRPSWRIGAGAAFHAQRTIPTDNTHGQYPMDIFCAGNLLSKPRPLPLGAMLAKHTGDAQW